jgi:hypothetical protein
VPFAQVETGAASQAGRTTQMRHGHSGEVTGRARPRAARTDPRSESAGQ